MGVTRLYEPAKYLDTGRYVSSLRRFKRVIYAVFYFGEGVMVMDTFVAITEKDETKI